MPIAHEPVVIKALDARPIDLESGCQSSDLGFGFQNDWSKASLGEFVSRGQAGKAGAHDDNSLTRPQV
jgi:hypothetical protein